MLTVAAATGCRELDHNGDLEGQWQIMSIEWAGGSVTDPHGEYYYCFYRDICQLTNIYTTRITANMAYEKSARIISLQFPYDDPAGFSRWGLTGADAIDSDPTTVRLTINALTSSRLIMTTSSGTVITLRKW